MHTMELFCVKDKKVGFTDPVCLSSSQQAVREFCAFLSQVDSKSDVYHVPANDFRLWHVGTFDLDSGVISPISPELVADADSLVYKNEVIADEKPVSSGLNKGGYC